VNGLGISLGLGEFTFSQHRRFLRLGALNCADTPIIGNRRMFRRRQPGENSVRTDTFAIAPGARQTFLIIDKEIIEMAINCAEG
jgi:hypothetical protein